MAQEHNKKSKEKKRKKELKSNADMGNRTPRPKAKQWIGPSQLRVFRDRTLGLTAHSIYAAGVAWNITSRRGRERERERQPTQTNQSTNQPKKKTKKQKEKKINEMMKDGDVEREQK